LDNGNVIRPLILDESANDAEALASLLRNAGYAVRFKHIQSREELEEAINNKTWDLLLMSQQVGGLSAIQAISVIKHARKDIPCIVTGSDRSDAIVIEHLQAGAADFVSEDAQDHLLMVIKRELANINERREHRHCKSLYNESEKRNRVLLDSSRDPIAYIHEGMHIYANQSYQDIFGYSDIDELESIPIMDLIAPEEQQSFKDVLRSLSNHEPPEETLEYNAIRQDGQIFKANMDFSRASIDGEPCAQVLIHRAGDNKELEKEIQLLKQQDLQTGLYNYQYFMGQVQEAIGRCIRGDDNCAVLYLEPDNFKSIKDTLGIAGSDVVLADMAKMLQGLAPKDALVARYAGTIFTILLCGSISNKVEDLAEAIRQALNDKIFEVESKTVTTTCSIGITRITEIAQDAKKTLLQAESACVMAKENKGNQVHVFSLEDELASQEADKRIVTLIKLALKNNRFQLQFQPIASLHAEPGERYEVLLRLLDQDGSIIMPGDFIPAAHLANLMTEVDRWVIKAAAKAILEKRKIGKELQFFIKLSGDSLRDTSIAMWISKLLQAARLHGSCLVFEIDEQSLLENLKIVKAFSTGIEQLQCNLAIDHVGKGAIDFSYLKHIKAQYLKIDGSHIKNINEEESQEAVKQIAEAARAKGIMTVAEHVQDPACLAILWQHGVNFIQGHYLQSPENSLDYDFSSAS
jgi:diguanylate cyclase (GGDEF)-like protein/PAS domain S-box-containing protein